MSPARFGPLLMEDETVFRLWAPAAHDVTLLADHNTPMERSDDGWFTATLAGVRPGLRYRFSIDGEIDIPDPATHFQADDVHGPSEVIDHRHDWQCTSWKGLPWEHAVFLEAHVGTFTPEGTFRAMIDKLDHLADTGITALELMPLADFPGRWNWGYDGVLLYAPDSSYGRPEDLKALIDAAHRRGIMMFLDVVYNHFGPEGNYLHRIAPQFFSDAHTPWGGAINYAHPEVRAFAIENALHWLDRYRFDGLRLDAVHAIATPGEPNILNELSAAVGKLAADTGRHIHLVLENDDNSASLLAPTENPPSGRYRAQWNDDYHHAWHVQLTGESAGYYKDYKNPAEHIGRTMAEGFAYQGDPSPHREGKPRGEPSRHLSPLAFVNFIQNHDQIGNRPKGERLASLAPEKPVEAALAVLLLQPAPPLLFMGEEWGATEPFPFFCDFKGELAQAVREGRKREFADAYAKSGDDIPDPLSERTRKLAALDWGAAEREPHRSRLILVRDLLKVRRERIAPLLTTIMPGEAALGGRVLHARWVSGDKSLHLLANLADSEQPAPAFGAREAIWGGVPPAELPPWSVYAGIGDA